MVNVSNTVIPLDYMSYGQFGDNIYLPLASYTLTVTPTNSNDVIATYEAPLAALPGRSIMLFTSGYVTGRTNAGI